MLSNEEIGLEFSQDQQCFHFSRGNERYEKAPGWVKLGYYPRSLCDAFVSQMKMRKPERGWSESEIFRELEIFCDTIKIYNSYER